MKINFTSDSNVKFLTASNYYYNVHVAGSLASVFSIQFTENSSPKQDPICFPLTISYGGQYVAHED